MKISFQSRWEALLYSLLVPGLGQWIAGKKGRGLAWFVFLLAQGPAFIWLASSTRFTTLWPLILLILSLIPLWLIMLADAYFASPSSPSGTGKPAIASILSFLMVGLGQWFNRQWLKGGLLLVLFGTLFAGALWKPTWELGWVLLFDLLTLWAMVDAYLIRCQRDEMKPTLLPGLALVAIMSMLLTNGFNSALYATTQTFKVPTNSMNPTLLGATDSSLGDHLIVNKWAYRCGTPQRGDIVVFKTDNIDHPMIRKGIFYVKRIVGLPGETLQIEQPHLLVNGQRVTDPPIFKTLSSGQNDYPGFRVAHPLLSPTPLLTKETDQVVLGDEEYLVMADNSPHSLDGRHYGAIQRKDLVGKVVRIYWPFGRAGLVE